ncbi:probable peptidyl-tRNA hydrolase [Periophthalmus magnuspinnatus]|uniref:probable peptidyl-tRNA hydrolase n=1 Tax=Periophthalmus magnuspinnatus TaxID=409849 RepID=UPI002436FA94|nr:probable peptidyl-tRNA hydrolase [Periophthalmus magnuspinnatus]XP_055080407.1 probable peptidyl-tRNA hydrolase [Periophthalmus magnuspinnatus]
MTGLLIVRRVCRRLSQLLKDMVFFVVNFNTMRRVLRRVLLSPPFTTAMETEALHTDTRRKMVVGLGNPGMDGTRHNVGRAVLDCLAVRLGASGRWRGDRQLSSELIVCDLDGGRVILLKPKLLMNVNGAAVAKAVQKFGVRPEDVLLVHDELDKPLGKIAVKLGGSARGHNGVRSCVDCLNTDVMRRVRVGIGRPSGHTSVDRHVLGRFSPDQRKVLDSVLVQSVDLLLSLLSPPGGAADAHQQAKQKKQTKQTKGQTEEKLQPEGQEDRAETATPQT